MVSRLRFRVASALALSLMAGVAFGQTPPAAEPPAVTQAKDLFRRGVTLFEAGDVERALALFLESRAAFPSFQNTTNAAICLDRLGRYDEALELYEQVLTEFADALTPAEKESIGPAMEALRARVGSLFVSANVNGNLLVDGRPRGSLPLTVPVRVLPGERVLRVIAPGYETFEKTIVVEATGRVEVNAELLPLADAGLLRITEASGEGSTVYVDGSALGETPWEGTIGPGEHVVWLVDGDRGTAPRNVVVVQGQTAVVELTPSPLGAPITLRAQPATATLALDGVPLRSNRFEGRLPTGSYRVRATEEGYVPAERVVESSAQPQTLALSLEIDPSHPRWPQPTPGHGFMELSVGYGLSPSLAGGASDNCLDCPGSALAHGVDGMVRGGYRFPFGLSLELEAGYLRITSSFSRTVPAPSDLGATLALDDDVLAQGPSAAFGLGYRWSFAEGWHLDTRVAGGVFLSAASDAIEGTAEGAGGPVAIALRDEQPVSRQATPFVRGALGVAADIADDVELGLDLGVRFFVLEGPTLDDRRILVPYRCDPTGPPEVGCLPSDTPLADEVAHGTFLWLSPSFRVAYRF